MMKHLFELNKLHEKTKVVWTTSGGMYLCKYDESFAAGRMKATTKLKYMPTQKEHRLFC